MHNTEFIAYFVQRFPSLRTTFIRREIEALRRLNVPLRVVSMRTADPKDLCGDKDAQAHLATTESIPDFPLNFESIWSNFLMLLQQPSIYLHNWRLAFADAGWPGFVRRVRLWLQIWRGAVLARRLKKIGGCRHIHAQFADGAATTALVASKLINVPFSFMSHTSHDSPALREKLQAARFVVSISDWDKTLLARCEAGVASRTHIIRCGIPLTDWPFRNIPPRNSPPLFVSIGALIEKKGHDILIKACALLRECGMQFQCKIVGGGALAGSLQELINNSGLEKYVELTGPLPQNKVREYLYAADLSVLACKTAQNSDTDGIPVSLMEAMAAGVPVVSTSLSGIPELIKPEETGLLSEPDDPASLAQMIRRVLDNPGATQNRVINARKWVEESFNQENEAKKLSQLLGYHKVSLADARINP